MLFTRCHSSCYCTSHTNESPWTVLSQQAVEAAESTQCTESTDNACNHNMCIQTCIWTYDHVPTLNFAIKAETTGFIQGDVHQDVHKEGVRQGFPTANVWGPPVHSADIRTTNIKDFFVCALTTVRLATYFSLSAMNRYPHMNAPTFFQQLTKS